MIQSAFAFLKGLTDQELGSTAIKGIVAYGVQLWCGLPVTIYALLVLSVIDYCTGLIAGKRNRELSSEVGAHGIRGKALMFCVVAAVYVAGWGLTQTADIPIELGKNFAGVIAGFYAVNELVSIIENAGRAKVWIPKPLKKLLDAFAKLREN